MTNRLIALIAGGTAGHVNLAIATAEAFGRIDSNVDVLFIGARNDIAAAMIAKTPWSFESIPGRPFQRTGVAGKVGAVTSVAPSLVQGRRLLRARSAAAVVGFGAYASFGGTLAARTLGIPATILEPNAKLGMANRVLRHVADHIFLGWAECEVPVDEARKSVCGVPVRHAFEALRDQPHDAPAVAGRPARVFIMAGSEPSQRFNDLTGSLLRRIREQGVCVEVRHQAGPVDVGAVRRSWTESGIEAIVEERLDEVAEVLDWSDYVIARSGASTIAETAIVGRPALFVPLAGSSEDHQTCNAALIAERGGAQWAGESSWNEEILVNVMLPVLESPERWSEAAARMRQALEPGAAERIAHDVLSRVGS